MDGLKPRAAPIIEEEAARHGMTVERFLAPIRLKERVRIRQYAMWRIRKETGRSWSDIARSFDCDHTTVMHAYRVIENLPPEDRTKVPKIYRPPPRQPAQMFLGEPCRHGHSGLRYLAKGSCVECVRLRDKERAKNEWKKKASASNFCCTPHPQEDSRSYPARTG